MCALFLSKDLQLLLKRPAERNGSHAKKIFLQGFQLSLDENLVIFSERFESGQSVSRVEVFEFLPLLCETNDVMPAIIGTIHFGSGRFVILLANADLALHMKF